MTVTVTTSVDSLRIGEIGDKIVEIRDSVTRLQYDLSASMVSQISVTVHDPQLQMHNNNYFMIGRTVHYLKQKFEIADVTITHDSIDTTSFIARLQATQKMRRDKGQKSFGNTSPSEFAAAMAAKFGLKIFAEDSPRNGTIVRESNKNKDESTFDVLQRLARDLDFRFFEAKGVLFFASEEFIVENSDKFELNVPSEETDPHFILKSTLKRSTDTKKAASAQITLLQSPSSLSIYPGAAFKVLGVSHFDKSIFMVDKVAFNAGPTANITISGTSVFESDDVACALEVFKQGSKGECVKRIQMVCNTTADGIWGPITQRQVLLFQKLNGLTQDGIWGPEEWEKIQGNFVKPSPSGSGSSNTTAEDWSGSEENDMADPDDMVEGTGVNTPPIPDNWRRYLIDINYQSNFYGTGQPSRPTAPPDWRSRITDAIGHGPI